MTRVTIIIHEGRGGRPHGRRAFGAQPGSEMGRGRHSRHGGVEMGGERGCGHHGHRALDAQSGSAMEHGPHGRHADGDQPRGERGFGGYGHHRHGHHGRHGRHGHHGSEMDMGSTRGCGCRGERAFGGYHRRPDHELSAAELAQRQLARQLRHDVRRVLREAEAAGLSPERAARVARRETRREEYL